MLWIHVGKHFNTVKMAFLFIYVSAHGTQDPLEQCEALFDDFFLINGKEVLIQLLLAGRPFSFTTTVAHLGTPSGCFVFITPAPLLSYR